MDDQRKRKQRQHRLEGTGVVDDSSKSGPVDALYPFRHMTDDPEKREELEAAFSTSTVERPKDYLDEGCVSPKPAHVPRGCCDVD